MDRAGDFLGPVLRRLNKPEAALAWLSSTWPTIVGNALAAHTRPTRCDNHSLELTADGKPWQQEVESMKRELCFRINRSWGGTLVRDVKFLAPKPGPAHISHELDNNHTPFIHRRRA
jgi:predicted nucleic acid-binding Zn ribbon protein